MFYKSSYVLLKLVLLMSCVMRLKLWKQEDQREYTVCYTRWRRHV